MSQNSTNICISKSDFGKICRLCLKEKETMNCLYNSSVVDMLKNIINIKFFVDDGLPDQICTDCKHNSRAFYKFKKECEKSNKLLWSLLDDEVKDKIVQSPSRIENENTEDSSESESRPLVKEESDEKSNWNLSDETPRFRPVVHIKEEDNRNDAFLDDLLNDYSPENDETDGEDRHKSEINSDSNCNEDDCSRNKIIIFKVNSDKDSGEVIERNPPKPPVTIDPEKCDLDTLTCKICGRTLVTKHTLLRHMETHNENRKITHTCPVCNKPFYNVGQYNKHMRWHEGKTRYNCEICDKPFFELSAQAVHMKKHKVKPMSCDVCQKQFLVKLQLEIHKRTHEKKEYFCSVCKKSFPQKCLVKKHERIHTTEKPFLCIKCSASFKQEWSLRIHMNSVHAENSHKEVCNVCGKSVKKLRYHMITHQNREKRHQCQHCDQSFYTGYSLNAHIRVKHATEKPRLALCPICGKLCETVGYLNAHMHTHKADRPYSCDECGKTFKLKVQLKSHKITHSDVRPFVCSMCGRGFTAKSVLKKHILTHTGERPHACHICQRAFAQRSALKTHMKTH